MPSGSTLPSDTVTALLHASSQGDEAALDQLFTAVYQELRRLARKVRRGRAGATLHTTALVHEAYLKLAPADQLTWEDRVHFFRIAACAMRQILVNAARRQTAQKRGGDAVNITLEEGLHAAPIHPEDVLALDEALHRLEQLDPRQARIIECRFFAGLTIEETAAALDISTPTVKRDWRVARAWLAKTLRAPD